MKYKTICFDYDGTLHESIHLYYPAFLKAYTFLVEKGVQPKKAWTKAEVSQFLGQNPKEMWASFEPAVPPNLYQAASKIIGAEMKRLIDLGQAKLYQGALEVLKRLKEKGYHLVYLSNAKIYYLEAHQQYFNLKRYIDDFVVSEMYDYIPKKDILKIISKNLPKPILMVGDRLHDMEAGYHNGCDTVACHYGYGSFDELKDATYHIHDITEILSLLI